MLSGRLPFSGETTEQLLKAHVRQPAPPLPTQVGEHVIPERLRQLVRRLLSKSPDERPASAAAVEAELALVAAELEGRPLPVEGIGALGGLDGEGPSQVDTQGRPLTGSGSMDLPASLRKLPPWAGWAAAGVAALALVIALLATPGDAAEADARPAVAAGPPGARATAGDRASQDPTPGRSAVATADARGAKAAPNEADAGATGQGGGAPEGPGARDAGATAPADVGAAGSPESPHSPSAPSAPLAGEAAAPPAAPLDERKLVQVTSSPRGATVNEAGRSLGRTPLGLWVRPGEARTLVVTRRGYRDAEHVLKLEDAPEVKLELEPKKRKPKIKVKLL
jgi:serine/threonine-protein kinase